MISQVTVEGRGRGTAAGRALLTDHAGGGQGPVIAGTLEQQEVAGRGLALDATGGRGGGHLQAPLPLHRQEAPQVLRTNGLYLDATTRICLN